MQYLVDFVTVPLQATLYTMKISTFLILLLLLRVPLDTIVLSISQQLYLYKVSLLQGLPHIIV